MRHSMIVSLLISLVLLPCARADVPRTLSYQGLLRDDSGAIVPDGDYTLTFRLYGAPVGSYPIWQETQTLTVNRGVFDALLGAETPLNPTFAAPYWLGIQIGEEPELTPYVPLSASPYALRAAVADSAAVSATGSDGDWTVTGDDMHAAVPGYVGIGVAAPLAHLHVQRTDVALPGTVLSNEDLIVEDADAVLGVYSDEGGSYGSAISLGEINDGALIDKWTIVRTTGLNSQLRFQYGTESYYPNNPVALTVGNGNIGLGTTDLALHARLNIAMRAGTPMVPSAERGILIQDHLYNGANRLEVQDQAGDTDFVVHDNGNVGIGTAGPTRPLTVRGNILILSASSGDAIVELGEGLDYAEGFDVAAGDQAAPGTVLVIDADAPGRLAVSREPYDRRVAGIVAGGRGLGSGVRLGVGGYDCDVALAGRVYCNADARGGAIAPGDLLTTSATPGHAMKAADPARAPGAILGKAMEPLAAGQVGQILVLVTLQ
ncbi:MAG: hypothetical protein JW819_12385 [Candidatus Krumholzibacteriota bacterium]|nr:hypothetical protein [Candidatus Krumholzibacteriota bacterium]